MQSNEQFTTESDKCVILGNQECKIENDDDIYYYEEEESSDGNETVTTDDNGLPHGRRNDVPADGTYASGPAGEGRLKCTKCTKTFVKSDSFERHAMLHTPYSDNSTKDNMIKCTNKGQFARMVELLATNPAVAKGHAKFDTTQFWTALTSDLNKLGPPARDATGWKKVWADLKYALKRKLSNYKRQKTKGKSNKAIIKLSELEQRIMEFSGLLKVHEDIENDEYSNYPGESDNTDCDISNTSTSEKTSRIDVSESSPQSRAISQTNYFEQQKKKPKLCENDSSVQNTVQIQCRDELTQTDKWSENETSDLVLYSKRISKSLNNIAVIKKRQLQEQMRHNKRMEDMAREKLILKRRILELKLKYSSNQRIE